MQPLQATEQVHSSLTIRHKDRQWTSSIFFPFAVGPYIRNSDLSSCLTWQKHYFAGCGMIKTRQWPVTIRKHMNVHQIV